MAVFTEGFGKKKAAQTVNCSCREASDATCVSRWYGLKILSGGRLSLPMNSIYHNMEAVTGKIHSVIEKTLFMAGILCGSSRIFLCKLFITKGLF